MAVEPRKPDVPSVPPRGSTAADRTQDPYSSTPAQDELSLVLDALNSVEAFHTSFVDKIEAKYRAYRGIAEKRASATGSTPAWRSKLTTPYILQIVEGMVASMLDSKPTWEVTPKPLPGEAVDDIMARQQSTRVATAALQWAMDEDDFRLKQRPFMQQDLICGITVAKCMWAYETRDCNVLQPVEVQVVDEAGMVRDRYLSTEESSRTAVIRDGPTLVVRDIRDFFWPEGAKSVDDSAWLIDRSWHTYHDLMQKQKDGYYQHVEELSESQGGQSQHADTQREQMLRGQDRNAGLIEVCEYWTDERVITVGDRKVVLASVENPLQIKRKPFVVCSAMPDSFEMVGISVVESLAQVQEYLWTVQNQRIDALRLLTNVITLVRSDVDDPDQFEWYPGATWVVEDPGQVQQLKIDAAAAQITLEAESLLKGDLQNMLGGLPFAGGADSVVQGAGGSTATGMSIISSIAQKMIQARKQHYMWAWAKAGEMFLGMMGQMLREERAIPQLGPNGSQQLLMIHPLDLQGEFEVNVNVLDESSVRQENISEAMALFNTAASAAPVMPLDLKPYMEKVLRAYGVQETAIYLQPPQPPPAPPAPPGGAPPGPGGTPMGVPSIQQALTPPGVGGNAGGQTNSALAQAMGGNNGLTLSPQGMASSQIQAVQGLGLGAQR